MTDPTHMMGDKMDQLKCLVQHTLEKKGVLRKLKSDLRKHVFAVIEGEPTIEGKQCLIPFEQPETRRCFDLIREFLAFYKLEYTLSLLQSEAGIPRESCYLPARSTTATEFGLGAQKPKPEKSLLEELVEKKLKIKTFLGEKKSYNDGPLITDKLDLETLLSKDTEDLKTIDMKLSEIDRKEKELRDAIKQENDDYCSDEFPLELDEDDENQLYIFNKENDENRNIGEELNRAKKPTELDTFADIIFDANDYESVV